MNIPYTKDPEATAALRRLNSPPKKRATDPAARERDEKLVIERCKVDVLMLRAISTHPRIRPLSPRERKLLLTDAKINAPGSPRMCRSCRPATILRSDASGRPASA